MILIVGATGNLGGRICGELVKRGATVKAIVRNSTDPEKMDALKKAGVTVIEADLDNVEEITKACVDVACVVSAVAGLRDVIVDVQTKILDASIQAGVPRFIPSDFCTDYNELVAGENRNFDLRREFKEYLDGTSIKATSIFTGMFADILRYNTPVLNLKDKSIAYWGEKADWELDFTTMDNTAAFTAEAALDDLAPRNLHVASFQVSPNMIQSAMKEVKNESFKIHQMAGLEDFAQTIEKQRAEHPEGENELYAKWQQAQYVYSMFSTHHPQLDNERYEDLKWTSAAEFLGTL